MRAHEDATAKRRTGRGRRTRSTALVFVMGVGILAIPTTAAADPFAGPVFGLGTDSEGNVVVADAGRGIARVDGSLIAELPGVTDVAASDQGWLWATTGGGPAPTAQKLFKVFEDGTVTAFADLGAYEAKHNPHPAAVDSNPFGVVDLGGGGAAVADAGGNTLLKVTRQGKVKLIAVLPDEVVSTDNIKAIVEEIVGNLLGMEVSCEDGLPADAPPEAHETCALPARIPAEPVATSVAIGPDGDFYVGELKGFPGPLGESKVWHIASEARNAECGASPLCSVAYDGFTSIVGLAFDTDGTLYVAEMDEKSFLAVELNLFEGLPVDLGLGTIDACNGTCAVELGGIPLLSAITVDGAGDLWHAELTGAVTSP
jgi:hypothetical protein